MAEFSNNQTSQSSPRGSTQIGQIQQRNKGGFQINLNKIRGNSSDVRLLNQKEQLHGLSSPVLSQIPHRQIQAFLSPRVQEKQGLLSSQGQRYLQGEAFNGAQTARESNPQTAAALGRVKTNNYFGKNSQQLAAVSQKQENRGGLSTAGNSTNNNNPYNLSVTSLPQIQLLNNGGVSGQGMISPTNFNQQQLDGKHQENQMLQKHIQALKIQHQMTVAAVAGLQNNANFCVNNENRLSQVELDEVTPRLGGGQQDSREAYNDSLPMASQNIYMRETTSLDDTAPTFSQFASKHEISKMSETVLGGISTQIHTTQNSIDQRGLTSTVNHNTQRKKGKTRNNKGSIGPPENFQIPVQYTATTQATNNGVSLPQTPFQNWHTQSDIQSNIRSPKEYQYQQNIASPQSVISYQNLPGTIPLPQLQTPAKSNFNYPSSSGPASRMNMSPIINCGPPKFGSQLQGGMINLEDITPEIAAFVVRTYLLPMFESDFKKSQRAKRNGDIGTSSKKGQHNENENNNNTVYGELKLSEQLQLEIYSLRDERDNLKEQVEQLTLSNKELEKIIRDLQINMSRQKVSKEQVSSKVGKLEKEIHNLVIQLGRVQQHNGEALNLATVSETYRKEFASKLQIEKVKNDIF